MKISATQRKLARRHLDALVARFAPIDTLRRPPKGWVRAVRDALGMTAEQLGQRMAVAQSTAAELEQGEVAGTTTIATLERAAAALGCRLVYAFVPESSFDELVRQRAIEVATRQVNSTAHTMELEKQGVGKKRAREEIERIAADLVRTEPRSLWQKT